MSEHGPPNPQLFSTPITSPSAAAAGGAGGELRGPASLCHCSYVDKTHSSRSLFVGHWPVSALPSKRRARLNTCRSRPVRARCTRCRCFYVYVLVSLSHHKTTFHNVSAYFLKPLGSGQPYVICQDKTHLEELRLRVGTGASCVRTEGSRSLA